MNNLEKYYNSNIFKEQGHELVDFLAKDFERQITSTNAFPLDNPGNLFNILKKDNTNANNVSVTKIIDSLSIKFFPIYSPYNFGYQVSVPTPAGSLFNFSEAYFNASTAVFGSSFVGNVTDKVIINWIISKIGYEPGADGIITTGATLGNLTALLTARAVKGKDVWNNGNSEQMGILVSEQAHYCIDKAARTMGFGSNGIIKIKTNSFFQMDLEDLASKYKIAKESGINIIAVVGSACTTSTGSFDDLKSIANFCKENDLWFHVDGAHGGPSVFSEKYKSLVDGISEADSMTIDLHKMMMSPNAATVVLYKKAIDSYKTFSQDAEYLFSEDSDEQYDYGKRTYECTKSASGLRTYGVLKLYGEVFFKDVVEYLFDLGKEFAAMIKNDPLFELLIEPSCNIVCFRVIKEGADLDEINKNIKKLVNDNQQFYINSTIINKAFYLRVVIMNPLTTPEHLESLLGFIKSNI